VVLVLGEIVPSAIMTGPRQLALAARATAVTWLVIAVFFPIAYPLSLILDWVFGHEGEARAGGVGAGSNDDCGHELEMTS
jgi:metal transporter CNNM